MAKAYELPPEIEIAALKNKGKGPEAFDLMRPGNGTPWEERGVRGPAPAFFATCFRSLKAPALLVDHISQTNTTGDATRFVWACGLLWSVSSLIHNVLLYFYFSSQTGMDVDEAIYFMGSLVQALVVPVAVFLLTSMGAGLYYKLVATELKGGASPTLVYNVWAYCLGPSLLALLPVVGPPLALLWIFINVCVAGRRRLFISGGGAFVGAMISFAAILGAAGAAYFVGQFAWESLVGESVAPAGSGGSGGDAPPGIIYK